MNGRGDGKVTAHPLRLRLLEMLAEGDASPSELATELDEPLGNVAYHMGRLVDAGAATLVDTRPARGALEHVYRAEREVCPLCEGTGLKP